MRRRLGVLDAHAVVLHRHADAALLDRQAHVGAARMRVMLDVGQRLAHHLQHVDLLARIEFVAEQPVVQPNLDAGALGKLADGVLQRVGQAAPVHAQAERGEQFAQLAVGVVEAQLEFLDHLGGLLARAAGVRDAT